MTNHSVSRDAATRCRVNIRSVSVSAHTPAIRPAVGPATRDRPPCSPSCLPSLAPGVASGRSPALARSANAACSAGLALCVRPKAGPG